ncbi:glutathione-disulfide reductase [Pantanalinema sp. GBBB05]|uniref:glutathione-disulfide reductase n=1 Tax=Pantanalinema sp. GBBB05 TaxID=2604139 RepID=UPI001DF60739|nr:glutathione-disulfide reductase [Pantanalinema sp. GBBB05]
MQYDYNLFIIGAGPGGLAAAKRAAKYGARVAIAEQHHIGGVCVNQGCISKKSMVYASDFARLLASAGNWGWQVKHQTFDWQYFKAVRDQEVARLRERHQAALIEAGVELIPEKAILIDPHTIHVSDRQITAEKILLAVGGQPMQPQLPGVEYAVTSREMFGLEKLPQRIAIIGSGYIGVEFASILRAFEVEVTLLEQADTILHGFDQEVQQAVRSGLLQQGIHSFCNTTVKEIAPGAAGLQLTLDGDQTQPLTVDTVLCAIGRTPNLAGLGLEQAGVQIQDGAVTVDAYSRTSQANIFAIGDCTNRLPLTPVARAEGHAFAETEFGNHPCHIDYTYVPSAVFCRPEAAAIGMTEADARDKYGDHAIQCHRTEFEPLFSRLDRYPGKAMLKLVLHRSTSKVLGVHVVSQDAAEMIQGIAIAIKRGITKPDFDEMIGIHPTLAEEFFH